MRSATSRTASSWLATMTLLPAAAQARSAASTICAWSASWWLVGSSARRTTGWATHGPGHGEALLLPEGGLGRRTAGQRVEVEGLEHGGGRPVGGACAGPGQAQHELDVLGHGQLGQRAQHLWDHGGAVPSPPAALASSAHSPIALDGPAVRLAPPGQQGQEGALPRAGPPPHEHDLARAGGEGDRRQPAGGIPALGDNPTADVPRRTLPRRRSWHPSPVVQLDHQISGVDDLPVVPGHAPGSPRGRPRSRSTCTTWSALTRSSEAVGSSATHQQRVTPHEGAGHASRCCSPPESCRTRRCRSGRPGRPCPAARSAPAAVPAAGGAACGGPTRPGWRRHRGGPAGCRWVVAGTMPARARRS